MEYIRIGTDYYKMVNKPITNGSKEITMLPWTKHTIIDDHGKDFIKSIKKYEGFVTFPSHDDYKQTIDNFYNKYKKLSHNATPSSDLREIESTLEFLKHIFKDQITIGLDYLTILWRYPLQILPILCLVSEERNTGKTTFLNWLKLLFENNMTINKNEDFRSRFNSDWSEKLIIAIDEVLLDKREDSERIKNLSTAAVFKTESKGKDKVESGFFGKFILCSNNEDNFILIDKNEIRYWVIKVATIPVVNSNLFNHLLDEVGSFAAYIKKREIVSPKTTRMWFTKEQIHTAALDNLVQGTKFYYEKELKAILLDKFEEYETDTICLTTKDIIEEFQGLKYRITHGDIQKIAKNWKLEPKNSSYFKYYKSIDPRTNEWQVSSTSCKGRYYTFKKEMVVKS